jgi:tRNA dimethylallyltransferase
MNAISDDMIEAQFGRGALGKDHQSAGNHRRDGTRGPHRCDELSSAGRQPDPRRRGFELARLRSGKQRDALFEREGEVDFAVHSAAGDFGDLLASPDELAEFVEHFILDDRRFEIGDEKSFAPRCQGLDDVIDRCIPDRGTGSLLNGLKGNCIEDEIAGQTRCQPDRGCSPHGIGDALGKGGEIRAIVGAGDQGEDHQHRASSYRADRPRNKRAAAARDRAPAVIIVAGPTASGKSALALELAENLNGTVINADAIQCYRDLQILTARPDQAAERRAPHRLYGFLDAAERGSAERWRALALEEIGNAIKAGFLPILVGGSGLYLRALTEGLALVPQIPEAVRQEATELYRSLGGNSFRARLAPFDPVSAHRLASGDKQRLIRAFEVVRATGLPIGTWQRTVAPRPGYRFATILLAPPRDRLYAACNLRFGRMIETGALTEAARLAARALDPDLPAMKALGFPELLSHLQGEMRLDAAVAAAQRATRRYAKRQMTWFRHQMTPDLVLDEQYSESLLRCSRHFIDQFLLTGQG